jgi:deoxyribodipyrimidine photolyase-related protein
MERILYIPFDHLHRKYGVLATADPEKDLIVLVESARMVTGERWHKTRLFFMISAARHFAAELEASGFQVLYRQAATTIDGLTQVKVEYPGLPLFSAQPSSHRQSATLTNFGITFVANDFFLTPRQLFEDWAKSQKSFLMESFYRGQRIRLNVLVEGNQPIGGQWNFDKDNRLPPRKNYTYPPYVEHSFDTIDREVAVQLGIEVPKEWATTRTGALRVLNNFIENHFADFGPYEDAMTSDNWALHHSLLSPYINIGLLHPSEVLEAALAKFEEGSIPLSSAEGFIRQIIGWREYINGMYWYLGPEYSQSNHLGVNRPLLPLFTDSTKTRMNCLRIIVSDIESRAWVHHIPRLMVLSNLALIAGVNPQEFLDWMRSTFIDATDWVMVPNVIGMGLHADGGRMMTKPYAAGGAYISRMSDYCGSCEYDPKKRVGETACPFTTLYWDFLARNREEFRGNHRMGQQLAGIDRLSDLEALQQRAQEVLSLFEKGLI